MMVKKKLLIIFVALLLITGLVFFAMGGNGGNDITENEKNQEEVIQNETNENESSKEEGILEIDIGKKAPEFTLDTLDGDIVSLSDYKGKIVLINFWATTCPFCVIEMPDLDKLYRENKDNDFVVLGIDVAESKNTVESFIDEGGYSFPILLDMDGEVSMKYLLPGIPVTVMVDEEGIIRAIQFGAMKYPQMKEMLEYVRGL